MVSMPVAPGALAIALEIVLALRVIGEADEFRIALLGDVDVVEGIGAAHVERGRRARGAHHAEAGEELLLQVEVGRPQPPVGHVLRLDQCHVITNA